MRFAILISLLFASTLTACGQSSSTGPTVEPEYYFPQQAPVVGERAVMEALLYGHLVSVEGCLRINQRDSGTSYLVIWPPNVTLSIVNDSIEIHDESGQLVAQIGDNIRISGGEIPLLTSSLTEELSQPIPETCPGPYWVVGEEIRIDP